MKRDIFCLILIPTLIIIMSAVITYHAKIDYLLQQLINSIVAYIAYDISMKITRYKG